MFLLTTPLPPSPKIHAGYDPGHYSCVALFESLYQRTFVHVLFVKNWITCKNVSEYFNTAGVRTTFEVHSVRLNDFRQLGSNETLRHSVHYELIIEAIFLNCVPHRWMERVEELPSSNRCVFDWESYVLVCENNTVYQRSRVPENVFDLQ